MYWFLQVDRNAYLGYFFYIDALFKLKENHFYLSILQIICLNNLNAISGHLLVYVSIISRDQMSLEELKRLGSDLQIDHELDPYQPAQDHLFEVT